MADPANGTSASNADDFVFSAGNQVACPDCGEMVRPGVVRCWNCGAFMNKEVEKRYMAMQQQPPEVLYSDPATAGDDAAASEVAPLSGDDSPSDDGDEGGFELRTPSGGSADTFKLNLPSGDDAAPSGDDTAEATAGEVGEAEAAAESKAGAATAAEPASEPAEDDDPLMASILSDLKGRQQQGGGGQLEKLRGGVRTAAGFIIFCPYGCNIEVRDKHRGNMGKCPKCEAPFVVPVDPPKYKKAPAAAGGGGKTADTSGGKTGIGAYSTWLEDVRLHSLPPEKLKLKADAHAKDFTPVDVAMSEKGIVLVPMTAKGGLFGGGGKPEEKRKEVQELAAAGGPPATWNEGATIRELSPDRFDGIVQTHPSPNERPTIFQGIPVFGEGRIILTLPGGGDAEPKYLSLGLSQYREFVEAFSSLFGRPNLAEGTDIPLKDETFTHQCHYTDAKIHALQNLKYYRADPSVELVVAGYQCENCGLTVSEDGRKKEGLGGKAGKGIAKAKCPKCEEKMGDKKLETRKELLKSAEMQSET